MAAWKKQIVSAQQGKCIICGKSPAVTDRSWDHLVPAAFSGRANQRPRFGLVYMAHQRCNTSRGHDRPSDEMMARIFDVFQGLTQGDLELVGVNIQRVLEEQRAFVTILEDLQGVLSDAAKPRARVECEVA